MIFHLEHLSPADRYRILTPLVTPRPIAWVTTVDSQGRVNCAPFSFFNVFGSRPPLIAFAPGNRDATTPKDTAANIGQNQEFIVHLVDEPLGGKMVQTSASLPPGESELEGLDLKMGKAETLSVPRILEAPVALECREHSTLHVGMNRLVLGIVSHVHVRDDIMSDEGRLLEDRYHPLGRMAAPDWYCRTSDQYEIKRPD